MTDSLEDRIRRLEDLAAIQHLTALYGTSVDFGLEGSQPDTATLQTLFAEDATWYSTATDVTWRGQAEIVEHLSAAPEGLDFAMHSFTNPVIRLDGDTASATFLLWVGITGNEVFQRENLTYTRTADGWVIQSIDLRFGKSLISS
ncbi:nuclear transport factor 2 family protein [uncultured Amnibacterium sp.]|uniref:nuclear transport factor 2 family protein n=1 Tax=uncultured Amnibacterium sp. TaxID=1631851 RepID=UPI0035CAC70D